MKTHSENLCSKIYESCILQGNFFPLGYGVGNMPVTEIPSFDSKLH